MKFSKVRDVKSPTRGTSKSAGIDFYVPNFDLTPWDMPHNLIQRKMGIPHIVVLPRTDVLIPSGIKVNLPSGYMLMAADKSGVVTSKAACSNAGRIPKNDAFDNAVIIGAKIIDEDYQGEIYIHLINTGNSIIYIKPGMKIAQFILVPVSYEELEEIPIDELYQEASERGEGGFGSTNK